MFLNTCNMSAIHNLSDIEARKQAECRLRSEMMESELLLWRQEVEAYKNCCLTKAKETAQVRDISRGTKSWYTKIWSGGIEFWLCGGSFHPQYSFTPSLPPPHTTPFQRKPYICALAVFKYHSTHAVMCCQKHRTKQYCCIPVLCA